MARSSLVASSSGLQAVITGTERKTSVDHDFFGAPFIVYNVTVTRGDRSWNVQRRFSNFVAFHDQLVKKHGASLGKIDPPQKRSLQCALTSNTDISSSFVQKRAAELGTYIDQVLADSHAAGTPEALRFFEDWRELRRLKSETQTVSGEVPNEIQFKILFTGDYGTGKTSLIKRYAQNKFVPNYLPTLGVDFALKEIVWDNGNIVRLQLWDIAGQERFSGFTSIYYREAVAAVVVFDLTRPATFHSVVKWKKDIDTNTRNEDGRIIPVVLCANKSDSYDEHDPKNGPDGDGVSLSGMDDFVKEHGFIAWFSTSAKDNVNVNDAAVFLVREIMKNELGPGGGSEAAAAAFASGPDALSPAKGQCVIL